MRPEAFLDAEMSRRTLLKAGMGFAALELLSSCSSDTKEKQPALPKGVLGQDFLEDQNRILDAIKSTKDFPECKTTYYRKTGQVKMGITQDESQAICTPLGLTRFQVLDAIDTDSNRYVALQLKFADNVYFGRDVTHPPDFPLAIALTFNPRLVEKSFKGDEYTAATIQRYGFRTETGHPATPILELNLFFPHTMEELEGNQLTFILNKGLTDRYEQAQFLPVRFAINVEDNPPTST